MSEENRIQTLMILMLEFLVLDDTTPAEFGNADGENSTQMSTPNAPDTQDESGTPQDTPADTPESDPVEQSLDPPELR